MIWSYSYSWQCFFFPWSLVREGLLYSCVSGFIDIASMTEQLNTASAEQDGARNEVFGIFFSKSVLCF